VLQKDPRVKDTNHIRKRCIPVITDQNASLCVYDDITEEGETCAITDKLPELGERVQDPRWQRPR